MSERKSAQCPDCGYRVKVRADGTLGKHHLWIGTRYHGVCEGTGARVISAARKDEA